MADITWIKLKTEMFADEKIRLIESMPEADTILIVWVKLLIQAGKTNANGYIFLNKNVPFTADMISTLFDRPLNTIRLALKTLSDFGMITIDNEGKILIENWEKHQNIEGMERIREQNRLRKVKQREKEKFLLDEKTVSRDMSRDITQQNKNKSKNEDIEDFIFATWIKTFGRNPKLPEVEESLILVKTFGQEKFYSIMREGSLANFKNFKNLLSRIDENGDLVLDKIFNGINNGEKLNNENLPLSHRID